MNFQDKRVKYGVIASVVLTCLIAFQIYNKMSGAAQKAKNASGGKGLKVETQLAKRGTITPTIKLSGSLDPVWQADVAAKVAGRIEKVYVDVGSTVANGQLLAVLDSSELTASASSARGGVYDAKASLASADTTLMRNKKLYASGALSKQELDNAQFARDIAAGKLEAAEGAYANAASKVNGTEILAPQGGKIIKRYFQEGYYATAGNPLFNIADTSTLVLKLNIPEGQIGGVQEGLKVDLVIPSMNNQKTTGTITKLASVADMPARTFAAEVTVDNSNNALRGGLFANVALQLSPRDNVLIIPQSAIVMREDQRTVYVVTKDGLVARKVLDTGYIGDGIVEVLSGITETDRVIVSGQNRVKEGAKVVVEGGTDK